MAYLLNSSTNDDTVQNWRQNLDNDETPDGAPVLDRSHGAVYQLLSCSGEVIAYSNTDAEKVHSTYMYMKKRPLPVHTKVDDNDLLTDGSIVLAEQIRTIDKRRLRSYIGSLDADAMKRVDKIIKISLEVL